MVLNRRFSVYAIGAAILGGLLLWKNSYSYKTKSLTWKIGKSLVDLSLILLTLWKMPGLVIAWTVMWLTQPIKSNYLRILLSYIAAIGMGALNMAAVEVLALMSVCSIDMITGRNGFLGHWEKSAPKKRAERVA